MLRVKVQLSYDCILSADGSNLQASYRSLTICLVIPSACRCKTLRQNKRGRQLAAPKVYHRYVFHSRQSHLHELLMIRVNQIGVALRRIRERQYKRMSEALAQALGADIRSRLEADDTIDFVFQSIEGVGHGINIRLENVRFELYQDHML